MASLTVTLDRAPGAIPGRWRKRAIRAASAAGAVARAAAAPHKASLARLWDMPLAVLGTGLADAAAFQGPAWLGLLVTGASLFLIEHLVSDPPDGTA